jgi:N-acetyl sugar amidotransferase
MDTTDAMISFDAEGVCDHCRGFDSHIAPNWHPDEKGLAILEAQARRIRATAKNAPFDCLIGMSGGLDSSYLLHLAVTEFDLRPLVLHVDGGWNTDLAVHNIQSLVDGLGVDLYTEVINWAEMRDFQLAFFKSGVPHLDIPQDHAFIAVLYHFALKHKVKYILNGGNFATECVRNPKEWLYYGTDLRQIRDIQGQFGSVALNSYPISGVLFHKVYLRYVRRIQVVKPLNYVPFTQDSASATLANIYGWRPYPQKHFESRFTKFYEGYWLPTRFGFDTRKVHFSSLILTGQMSRDQAVEKLKLLPYDPETIAEDFAYIATKLGISERELQRLHEIPIKSFRDFKNFELLFDVGAKVLKNAGIERAIKR